MSDDEKNTIVGHKTFSDGKGGFRHEPLTQGEADVILARCAKEEAKRAEDMPTEKEALNTMWQAYQRLRELGWHEACYCPKDGTTFQAIEAGSTGIHECSYSGEWPDGYWWIHADDDMWPSRPILYKLYEEDEKSA